MPVPGTAPGLLSYLAGRTGLSVDELTRALNIDSGLEGLSGVGNDMRTVVAAAAGGNERARLALEVFVYRLSKAIAGLVVGLQRLDALVFTGGIGKIAPLSVMPRLAAMSRGRTPVGDAQQNPGIVGRKTLTPRTLANSF